MRYYRQDRVATFLIGFSFNSIKHLTFDQKHTLILKNCTDVTFIRHNEQKGLQSQSG